MQLEGEGASASAISVAHAQRQGDRCHHVGGYDRSAADDRSRQLLAVIDEQRSNPLHVCTCNSRRHSAYRCCGRIGMGLGKVQLLATQRLRHWKDQSRAVRCRVRKYARPALYATLVAIALAVLVTVVPMKAIAASLVKWMQRHPTLGAFLIPVTLWVAIPLAIPSTIFEVLAGSLFGVIGGALISLAGKVGGAVIAFQLGKAIGRERVGNYLFKKFPSFRAICEVLQKSSWKPLLLLQVSSLPNALKCYGLAIVDISLFRFTVSTMIGGFPHAIMWGFVGNQARDVLTSGDGDGVRSRSSRTIFMVGGMVCTALAMGFLVYYTRKELLEMQTKVDHKADGDSDDDTTDLEDPHSPLGDSVAPLPPPSPPRSPTGASSPSAALLGFHSSSSAQPKHRTSVTSSVIPDHHQHHHQGDSQQDGDDW